MIRHLLKLVWNRKRANALLILEMAASFLVVFAVAAAALVFADRVRRPLGFAWQGVWNVSLGMGLPGDLDFTAEQTATFERVLREAASLPGVEAAGGIMAAPYSFSTRESSFQYEGRDIDTVSNEATVETAAVLGLEPVFGRWFAEGDGQGSGPRPVVVNRRLARELFGVEDVAGKMLQLSPEEELRVVGVVDEFRQHGELSAPGNYIFHFKPVGEPEAGPLRELLLRLAPGTPASFEPQLLARLQAVAPTWSFEVTPLETMRDRRFRFHLAPVVLGAVVGGFLLLMVALGVLGVLWQNVAQRTRELGLRRAAGASRGRVYAQILAELLIVTSLGLALGTVVVAQIPLLDLVASLTPAVWSAALALAAGIVLALAAVCGLYPGWLATRVEPATALRYE